ncbi:DUF2917 domain-containing protein [Acidovorax sp. JMULE5]|uniref:DUF2917 domain-containing protein n=1 Tax=Acidovorax sp. JMULE5 TaxID=2518343 RepID=UPI0015A48EC1|nr:DUF2917 domain-containing protein [Acidovorax sp. JMULE5]QLA81396.1 DUF2917 domain-containing protein [Acidovorax sp. JMULE5]
MTTSYALHLFASSRAVAAAAGGTGTVAAGAAVTLAPKAAMVLRIAEGQAWVTLGQGLGDSSDLFLCAGQSLPVAAGQSVVVEPLNGRRLQYRWVDGDAASARPASWWRRASVGNGAPAWGDACCA